MNESKKENAAAIFIHGGSITADCWNAVLPLVKANALAFNLPGRADCPADHHEITIELGARFILASMEHANIASATLIGHSFSGVILVKIAELAPERVDQLVFVACVVPGEGQRILDVLLPHHARMIQAVLDADGVTLPVIGSSEETLEGAPAPGNSAQTDLVPEPALPYREKTTLAGLGNGINCAFVKLMADTAQTPELQDASIARIREVTQCEVIELNEGHMVMYSNPRSLAAVINQLLP